VAERETHHSRHVETVRPTLPRSTPDQPPLSELSLLRTRLDVEEPYTPDHVGKNQSGFNDVGSSKTETDDREEKSGGEGDSEEEGWVGRGDWSRWEDLGTS